MTVRGRGSGYAEWVERKIFGIGLARTGTTSLHRAFELLGIASAPHSIPLLVLLDGDESGEVMEPVEAFLGGADAFTDNPIPFVYQRLDELCPGSKFVHTTRPVDDWLRSMRWLFGQGIERLSPEMRKIGHEVHQAVYGITTFDPDVLRRVHADHALGVAEYFADRPDDLLNVTLGGYGWLELCDFLKVECPDSVFPHENRSNATSIRKRLRSIFP